MRVMMRDNSDNTKILVEASDICYDPEDAILYVEAGNGDTYYKVLNVSREEADRIMEELFVSGRVYIEHGFAVLGD